jgi:hypothetical protein
MVIFNKSLKHHAIEDAWLLESVSTLSPWTDQCLPERLDVLYLHAKVLWNILWIHVDGTVFLYKCIRKQAHTRTSIKDCFVCVDIYSCKDIKLFTVVFLIVWLLVWIYYMIVQNWCFLINIWLEQKWVYPIQSCIHIRAVGQVFNSFFTFT